MRSLVAGKVFISDVEAGSGVGVGRVAAAARAVSSKAYTSIAVSRVL